MKQKMSKERMYELAMKKGVKADPKVLDLLRNISEEFKLKQSIKEVKQKEEEEVKQKKVKDIREQVVVKTLGFGVAMLNKKDFDADLLRPLDSVPEPKGDVQLIDMNSYEDHDREAVNSLFKLYGKLFKTYFVLYSSGTKVADKDTEATEQTITRSDLWSFLKDKKLDNQTTMEKLGDLIRQINLIHFNVRGDPNNLKYHGYKIFMLEISAQFFPSTIPMPPAFSLKRMLAYLQQIDAFDEKIAKIFDNPEYAGVDDYDLIKYLNEEVNKNPNMKIPETFSLNKRKIIDYEFKLNKNLKLPESYRVCIEILNDLISRSPELGFDFIEPTPTVTDIYYVKPKVFFKDSLNQKLQSSVLATQSGLAAITDRKKPKPIKEPKFLSENEKKIMWSKPLVELSTSMKLHVASYDLKDKAIAKDCALVLEELLQKASQGVEPGEGDYHLKIPIKITIENDVLRKQEMDMIRQQKKEIREYEEFKERDKELKESIRKAEEAKRIEEEKKRKEQRKKEKEIASKKRKIEKEQKKKAAKLKKEVEKAEQKEKKIKEERQKRAQKKLEDIEAKRKKKFLDFQGAQIRAFKKQWRNKWLTFKKQEALASHEATTRETNLKIRNANYLAAFQKVHKDLEDEKENHEKELKAFKESPQVNMVKNKFKDGIDVIFSHYCRMGFHVLGVEECTTLMDKGELALFCSQLGLYPVIVTPYIMNKWFSEIDLKEGISKYGINREQFVDFLVDCVYRNKEFLSKYYLDEMKKNDRAVNGESDAEEDKSPRPISGFQKRSEVKVMPSMRSIKKKDEVETPQTPPPPPPQLTSSKSKAPQPQPPAEDMASPKSRMSVKSKKQIDTINDISLVGSDAGDEDQIEKEINAFEGLMLYIGITEDKKEMQARTKYLQESFKHSSSFKREQSMLILTLGAKLFKESHGIPTETFKEALKNRNISVGKSQIMEYKDDIYDDAKSHRSKSVVSKKTKTANPQDDSVLDKSDVVSKKGKAKSSKGDPSTAPAAADADTKSTKTKTKK
jgi:hypothetical protein